MLQLVNISRLYKQKKGPTVKALDNVNITFNEKGMVFILGKSGSGKSTLLNVIGGLDKYTDGELFIKGKSTKQFKQNEFDSYRNTMIGFIFQEYNILDDFTVGQNIGIALELQGKKATSESIDEYLTLLDMHGYAHRKPNTLSGGQKQRVAIARALVKQPEIIMADEPTGALDSKTGMALFETMKKLSNEKLVIVVTHDQEFAETFGDRIIEFSDGRVIRDVTKVNTEQKGEKQTTFSDEGITINPRYELTEQDLKEINNYLRKKQGKTVIKVQNVDATFQETTQPTPIPTTNKIDLIRSRLPFKSALKMGASALKHKRFRLVLSILLASTAFTMFTLTDMMAHFNPRLIAQNQMVSQKVSASTVSKAVRTSIDEYIQTNALTMGDDDLTTLNALDPDINFYPIIQDQTLQMAQNVFDTLGMFGEDSIYPLIHATPTVTTLPSAELSKAGLSMAAGALPTHELDIALPNFIYEIFKAYGYSAGAGFPKVTVTSANDLVNKKYGKYTITGVVNTGYELDVLKGYVENQATTTLAMLFGVDPSAYLAGGFHYTYFLEASTFASKELPVTYISPTYGTYLPLYFNGELGGTTSEDINVSEIRALDTLDANDPVIFFDNTKDFANLTDRDLIIDSSVLYNMDDNFYSLVNNAKSSIRDTLEATALNDAAIEAMLRAYDGSGYFNVDISTLPAYTSWTNAQQRQFRGFYYYALIEYNLLFSENEFQPTLLGKDLMKDTLLGEVSTAGYAEFAAQFALMKDWSNTQYEMFDNLTVVGFYFSGDSYTNNFYISEVLATELELVETGPYSGAIAYHGKERAEITKFVNFTMPTASQTGVIYTSNNQVVGSLSTISQLMIGLSKVFRVIGIIFAIFAALLLVNFITLSVVYKKQEVGILRAIGARGIDVSTIFMNEAGIIALINFTLAFIATTFVSVYVNNYYMKETKSNAALLAIGFRQIVLLLAISLGVALISSFIPVYRLSRKKPIDAIKDR